MGRKLAHVELIHNIRPIEGCDNIEQCNILGWNLIIKKNEFKDGDKAIYIEIDSLMPSDNPAFEFLEKKKFRIKTLKMKGVISQGIAFPLSILPAGKYSVGDDVTELLKIKKIEDETPEIKPSNPLKNSKSKFVKTRFAKWLMRFKPMQRLLLWLFVPKTKKYNYPLFVVKTDEERIQNRPWVLEKYKDIPMQVTEKLDGTSTTFALEKKGKKFDFAVCSRNVRLHRPSSTKNCYYDTNYYWEMAFKYNAENVLKTLFEKLAAKQHIVLQGETIGEGIQKNKYNLKGNDFYAFNLVVDGRKINSVEATQMLKEYEIKWVPILEEKFVLKSAVNEMISYATGKSLLYDTLREGIVIRDSANTVSFKCISPDFLLKWDL